MPPRVLVRYDEALDLINEGDVLLFRGQGVVSSVIKKASDGNYTHVGLATWHHAGKIGDKETSILEVTEFREGYGGRTTNLAISYENHMKEELIDVYRAPDTLNKLKFDFGTKKVITTTVPFDGKAVTNAMRRITGMPYGWWRIWTFALRKLAFIRWIYTSFDVSQDTDKADFNNIYPVCSTAVAACFSNIEYDLVPNRSDEYTEPNDLARSALLNYMFTLYV